MMSPAEHYAEADRLLAAVRQAAAERNDSHQAADAFVAAMRDLVPLAGVHMLGATVSTATHADAERLSS